MRIEADLHTHSIASGHGYSTVKEMVEQAAGRGLQMLAITDHGLCMPGAPHLYHFTNMINWPRVMEGVEVLRGVEANIIGGYGKLDVPDEVLQHLDIVLAGFHTGTGYTGTTVEENTRAMIAAIMNPYVHIIVHPGNPVYPVDLEKVVRAAAAFHKVLEINNNSPLVRPDSNRRCEQLAILAKKHKVTVALNSDSHICYGVGECRHATAVAQKAGIGEEQILNVSAARVKEYLQKHKQFFSHVNQA